MPHYYQPMAILTYLIFIIVFGYPGFGSCASVTPINWYHNFLNSAPSLSFVMKSPIISAVVHYSTKCLSFKYGCDEIVSWIYVICGLAFWSLCILSQKNSTFIVLKDDFLKKMHPWASNQYLLYSKADILSSTAKISVSVKLCVLSFCFFLLTMGNLLPIYRPRPVCPLMFGCNKNDPKIYHFSMHLLLELRISGKFLVSLIYFIWWTNLNQLLLSGSITFVASNETVVRVSGLSHLVVNIIFATSWWNSTACLVLGF